VCYMMQRQQSLLVQPIVMPLHCNTPQLWQRLTIVMQYREA
jgi:hypothetical protein